MSEKTAVEVHFDSGINLTSEELAEKLKGLGFEVKGTRETEREVVFTRPEWDGLTMQACVSSGTCEVVLGFSTIPVAISPEACNKVNAGNRFPMLSVDGNILRIEMSQLVFPDTLDTMIPLIVDIVFVAGRSAAHEALMLTDPGSAGRMIAAAFAEENTSVH